MTKITPINPNGAAQAALPLPAERAPKLTRSEREELAKLVRARQRLAKRDLEQRKAELLAQFEQQMAREYKPTEDFVAGITGKAMVQIEDIRKELATACKQQGIPEWAQPDISAHWSSRGENAIASRRTELRLVAKSRLDALGKKALYEIEKKSVEALTVLAQDALGSSAAQEMLATLPSAAALMPPLELGDFKLLKAPRSPYSSIVGIEE